MSDFSKDSIRRVSLSIIWKAQTWNSIIQLGCLHLIYINCLFLILNFHEMNTISKFQFIFKTTDDLQDDITHCHRVFGLLSRASQWILQLNNAYCRIKSDKLVTHAWCIIHREEIRTVAFFYFSYFFNKMGNSRKAEFFFGVVSLLTTHHWFKKFRKEMV